MKTSAEESVEYSSINVFISFTTSFCCSTVYCIFQSFCVSHMYLCFMPLHNLSLNFSSVCSSLHLSQSNNLLSCVFLQKQCLKHFSSEEDTQNWNAGNYLIPLLELKLIFLSHILVRKVYPYHHLVALFNQCSEYYFCQLFPIRNFLLVRIYY